MEDMAQKEIGTLIFANNDTLSVLGDAQAIDGHSERFSMAWQKRNLCRINDGEMASLRSMSLIF